MNSFIDTHAHLFVDQFNEDLASVISRAKENGISHILLPNIDLASVDALHKTTEIDTRLFYPMMGLHPCSVFKEFKKDLKQIEELLNNKNYIAVGEIGLDYYWDVNFKTEQIEAFRTQINWAKELKLPIAIHTRDSFDDAIKIIEEEQNGNLTGVFHCFGGTIDEGKRVIDANFLLGIGGTSTFKNSNLKNVLPHLPLQKLILETDAPYLAPVPNRGKRNESSYIPLIAENLASIYEVGLDVIASTTTSNAKFLFNL